MIVNVAEIRIHIMCVCLCCCKTSLCSSDPNSAVPAQQQNLNKGIEMETKPASFWDTYDPINQLYLELGTVMWSMSVKLGFRFMYDCSRLLLLLFVDTALSRVFGWWCATEPFGTVASNVPILALDVTEYGICVGW